MDPKALTLPRKASPIKSTKAPRHKTGERFLRGPIPMNWLCAAAVATRHGSGFKVAMAIWYHSGLNKQARTVRLSGSVLRDMGVERHAGYRGLQALEKAGLVSVVRRPGQSPQVTLLGVGDTK